MGLAKRPFFYSLQIDTQVPVNKKAFSFIGDQYVPNTNIAVKNLSVKKSSVVCYDKVFIQHE